MLLLHSFNGINLLRMGDASEPTTEWGRYLRRMTRREGWSVARLARESGIARQTIFEWIRDGGESITVASVRAIARALDDDLGTALLAAGNISIRDSDAEVASIIESDLDAEAKRNVIEYLHSLRDAQKVARRAEIDAMLKRPRRAA